jgi:integrase
MPRPRQAIRKLDEGNKNVARFKHPLLTRAVRFDLGDDAAWRKNLEILNEIFMDDSKWRTLPATTPDLIRRQWLGRENTVTVRGMTVRKGSKTLNVDKKLVVRLQIENDALRRKLDEALDRIEAQAKEIEHWRGKKLHKGPSLTLQQAQEKFLADYTGRDADATKSITYDLAKFVKKFGPNTPVRKMEGQEGEITAWIRGLKNKNVAKSAPARPLSGSRRNTIRLYVLKMLTAAGAVVERKAVERAGKKEIRRGRGAIRWLTREQAELVAAQLKSPWREMFLIQVAIGLRPDELLTLHRKNFNADHSKLTLEPLEHLTLKTGGRTIPIPASIRPIVEWRLRVGDILFPDLKNKDGEVKPWRNPKNFNARFKFRLVKAATAAGITTPMDTRIGRRTCASLLLQDNVSAEKIAALLGNTPGMILEHYGDPDVDKLGPTLEKNVVGKTESTDRAETKTG